MRSMQGASGGGAGRHWAVEARSPASYVAADGGVVAQQWQNVALGLGEDNSSVSVQ